MKILALEFSSEQRSAAVAESNHDAVRTAGMTAEQGGRATRAVGLVEFVLGQAKWEREDIELIAVGIGPGSYTGIRAGIALVQGWQLGRAVKVAGISSMECLAATAHAEGLRGDVTFVIDAQKNEFYAASFRMESNGMEALEGMKIISVAVVQAKAAAGFLLVGPDAGRLGPAARVLFPSAAILAALAAKKGEFISAAALEPIYLRETNFVKAPPPREIR
jgi:tRNA threonylcarbamoyladenosine biosynthesis protein TsaB